MRVRFTFDTFIVAKSGGCGGMVYQIHNAGHS